MEKINTPIIKTTGLTIPSLIEMGLFLYHFDEKNQYSLNEAIQENGLSTYGLLNIFCDDQLGINKKTFNSGALSSNSIIKIILALMKAIVKRLTNLNDDDKATMNHLASKFTQSDIKIEILMGIINRVITLIEKTPLNQKASKENIQDLENLKSSTKSLEVFLNYPSKIIIIKSSNEELLLLTASFEINILLLALPVVLNKFEIKLSLNRTRIFFENKLKIEKDTIMLFEKEPQKYFTTNNYRTKVEKLMLFLLELIANLQADFLEYIINKNKPIEIYEKIEFSLIESYLKNPLPVIQLAFKYSKKETAFKRIMNYIAKIHQLDSDKISCLDNGKEYKYDGNLTLVKYIVEQLSLFYNKDTDDIKRNIQRYLSGEVIISDKKLKTLIKAITRTEELSPYYLVAKLAIKVDWLHKQLQKNGVSDTIVKSIFNQYNNIYYSVVKEHPTSIKS
jgi:hypothetical protein